MLTTYVPNTSAGSVPPPMAELAGATLATMPIDFAIAPALACNSSKGTAIMRHTGTCTAASLRT